MLFLVLSITCQTSDHSLVSALQKTMPGITQPFPNIFDPLSFLSNAGSSNTAVRDLKRWRESEITHGRVAMLVSLHSLNAHGCACPSNCPLQLYCSFCNVPLPSICIWALPFPVMSATCCVP